MKFSEELKNLQWLNLGQITLKFFSSKSKFYALELIFNFFSNFSLSEVKTWTISSQGTYDLQSFLNNYRNFSKRNIVENYCDNYAMRKPPGTWEKSIIQIFVLQINIFDFWNYRNLMKRMRNSTSKIFKKQNFPTTTPKKRRKLEKFVNYVFF